MYNPQHDSPCQLLKNTRECLETTVKNLDKVRAELAIANRGRARLRDLLKAYEKVFMEIKLFSISQPMDVNPPVPGPDPEPTTAICNDNYRSLKCRTCDKLRCGNCIYGPHRTTADYPKADNYSPAKKGKAEITDNICPRCHKQLSPAEAKSVHTCKEGG